MRVRMPAWLLLGMMFAVPAMAQMAGKPSATSPVKVSASFSKEAFRKGEKGEILIAFAAERGYHINVDPPVELAIDSGKVIQLKGKLALPVDKSNGYLSTRSPVRQTISVPKTVTPGEHLMKATVTYYYCSDAEGWCVKYRQPVTLSFTVVR